jgi:hypothetical protein
LITYPHQVIHIHGSDDFLRDDFLCGISFFNIKKRGFSGKIGRVKNMFHKEVDLMLLEDLKKRELPQLTVFNDGTQCTPESWPKRREELLTLLQENIYGYTPAPPKKVTGKVIKKTPPHAFAGKAIHETVEVSFDTPYGDFSFPLQVIVPVNVPKPPVFLHIAFRPDIPDKYTPAEELIDNGFALALFYYQDVVNDNHFGDYSDGLGKLFIGSRKREKTEWGKIGMWAYAASRAMDYLVTREDIDAEKVAVVGHSRLGKTALWCAARDTRFFTAISNNSGKGGASLMRHATGETVKSFLDAGSWDWFCEKWKEYHGHENEIPYDQHFVLACIAPRYILVGSAEIDPGADPKSEFLSCVAASEVYRLLGKTGLVTEDKYPVPDTALHQGEIGYHIRKGLHYFSRTDWLYYMDYLKKRI